MVADETILEDGPVTYLLSLEHQLTDPAEDWVWDENDAYWRSRNPEQRLRMEKGLKSLVLIAPTQHQLGQAQAVPDEHRTGVWEITKVLRRGQPGAQDPAGGERRGAAGRAPPGARGTNHAGAPPVSVGREDFAFLLGKSGRRTRTLCTHPSRIEGG